jgi:hypothetical protein
MKAAEADDDCCKRGTRRYCGKKQPEEACAFGIPIGKER